MPPTSFTFSLPLFNRDFLKTIENQCHKSIFKEYNRLNFEIKKNFDSYHLLLTDPTYVMPEKRFLEKAKEISAKLLIQNEALKKLSINSISPPESYWSYFSDIISNYINTVSQRFGSLEGELSKRTKPHANFMAANFFLLMIFLVIGITFVMFPPLAGLTIAFAIISALFITSIIATVLSITARYKVDHAIEKENFERSVSNLDKMLPQQNADLTNINNEIIGLIEQLENYYKNNVPVTNNSMAEATNTDLDETVKNLNCPSKISIFKPSTEKDSEQLNHFQKVPTGVARK